MKIKCLVVDDEPLGLDLIASYVEKIDNLELVARCSDSMQAWALLQTETIDLIFLDIHMPGVNGIQFLESLKKPPAIIFITADPDYALESFKFDALDYLLKPITFDRFLRASDKAFRIIISEKRMNAEEGGPQEKDFFFVKSDKKWIRIESSQLDWVEAMKDYVVFNQGKQQWIVHSTLKAMEEKIADKGFTRIHRSYLVNLKKVSEIGLNSLYIGETEIPIGSNYKGDIDKFVEKNRLT